MFLLFAIKVIRRNAQYVIIDFQLDPTQVELLVRPLTELQ